MIPTVFPTDQEISLYKALRMADILKYDDPNDDHPNLAVTSQRFRIKLQEVLLKTINATPLVYLP